MSNDVVLTAALRNNLLSLQSTQRSIDTTQFRLATGRKVNSALDNPQNFFASQALQNRASDLQRLLDGIGQNIQVIKAADSGITALTNLVEQADSVATSARDALAQGTSEAKIVGDRDLSGIDDLTTLTGITNADTLVFTITEDDGTAETLGAYGAASAATATVTISSNDSIEDLINNINNLHIDDDNGNALGAQAFEASLDDEGHLQIKTLNGGNFNVDFVTAAATNAANLALAADLGFGDTARLVTDGGAGTSDVEVTSVADVALRSFALYDSGTTPNTIADRSDLLSSLVDSSGNALFANLDATTDDYTIGVNGGSAQTINLTNAAGTSLTIQDFIDQINNNTSLNAKIEASYDETTGVLSISPIDASVESIEIGVADNNQTVTANFGFGIQTISATATDAVQESIRLASAAGQLAQFETDYNNIRDQITELVSNGDTGYRGTNLLFGDDLTTFFNEDRTSSLVTQGVTFTAAGLGISEADFSRTSSVDNALTEIRTALESVRNFGSTLANDLSIIQTREDFTKSLINTLTEGSDKLTIADQNEEGAKLLALQTRQQLGVTSLSLASQSQQSILRLF
ncbi:MAG: flagellin [Alphaproteobacteria bacterium]|nr:flagellin [Alphaproteobacteria bacterium]